jgi:hypothetical protein
LRPCNTKAKARRADVLTWESTADDVNGNSIGSKPFGCKCADVFIARNLRPMLGQYFAGEWLNFTKGHGSKAARPFKAKAKAAYAAEQIKDAQGFHAGAIRRAILMLRFVMPAKGPHCQPVAS